MHPLRPGLLGVVVVHAAHRRAQAALDGAIGGPHGMVEDHDLGGAGLAANQHLDFGVVCRLHFPVVVKILDGGFMPPEHEGLAIE